MTRRTKAAISLVAILAACLIPMLLIYNGIIWFNNPGETEYPVKGVDVSVYQGEIDWAVLAQQDIEFAFIKATEGSSHQDARFAENWQNAQKTPLIIGAYHFFSYDSDGHMQAQNFIATVPLLEGALPPVVDIEFYGGNEKNPPPREAVVPILDALLTDLEQHYGRKPILYATMKSYELYLQEDYLDYPLWIRNVLQAPKLKNNRNWSFWQYSHRERLSGYHGEEKFIDMNVWNGTVESFQDFVSMNAIPFSGCNSEATDIIPPASAQATDSIGQSAVWEMLHRFNWMSDKGEGTVTFEGKPFLQANAEGRDGAAGIVDINRDGEQEFLIAAAHVPRSIPSVDVFAMRGGRLESIGGFFASRENPSKLSYYRDKQGRLLLVQKTESHYGGIIRSLVVTDVTTWHTFPISSWYSDYDMDNTEKFYYLYTDDKQTELTSEMLYGTEYPNMREATEAEHDKAAADFMASLTWVEDVSLRYSVHYHLSNGSNLSGEIRGDEIAKARKDTPERDFGTPEELKKTSDMVADALYADYIAQ